MTTDFGRHSNKELIDYMKLAEMILDDDLYYVLALVYFSAMSFGLGMMIAGLILVIA
jgi:hypothetical protein